jgi:hypothetical protein
MAIAITEPRGDAGIAFAEIVTLQLQATSGTRLRKRERALSSV